MTGPFAKKTRSKWQLKPHPLQVERLLELKWYRVLPPGLGTKHQRSHMLRSAQGFLNAMGARSINGEHPAPLTIYVLFWELQAFVRWLVTEDIWLFSRVRLHHIHDYFLDWRKSRPAMTKATVGRKINLFARMYELRLEYVSPLLVDVGKIEATLHIESKSKPIRGYEAVEECEALPLLADAMQWVSTYSEYIADVGERLWQHKLRLIGAKAHVIDAHARLFYDEISAEPLFAEMKTKLEAKNGADNRRDVHRLLSRAA